MMSQARQCSAADRLFLPDGLGGELSIVEAFIRGNPRIEIISGDGLPTPVPKQWRPILRDSDILVLVPDMHMFVYTSPLDNFKFGAESMRDFLLHTEVSRQLLAGHGVRLQFAQLGDMFELLYPCPDGKPVTVSDISSSHPIYEDILRLFRKLECRYVVGNHDVGRRDAWGGDSIMTDGAVHVEHGYAADSWFHFTNPEHRHWRLSMRALRSLRRLETGMHRFRRTVREGNARHAAIGISSGECEYGRLPDPSGYPQRQLQYFESMVRQSEPSSRVCVIAHTHYPYLDGAFAGGECIFVDAGAWTEGRSDFVVITNSEVAICRYRRATRSMAAPLYRSAS